MVDPLTNHASTNELSDLLLKARKASLTLADVSQAALDHHLSVPQVVERLRESGVRLSPNLLNASDDAEDADDEPDGDTHDEEER